MDIDRNKAIKLVIVVIGTLAALAVVGILIQVIQTLLPFLIVAAGVYVGYRWALSDSAAPTADEVEEQARGLFSRFRKTRQAVESTMQVSAALNDMQVLPDKKRHRRRRGPSVIASEAAEAPVLERDDEAEAAATASAREDAIHEMKGALGDHPKGEIEFKDSDVVISEDDVVQPDMARLEEKEKEAPQVTDNVLAQIEERRRRLQSGE